MIADMHIHTYFSCDSMALMERYCQRAVEKGIKYLCFTDHVDYNKNDEGYGFYEVDKYFDEFTMLQKKYQSEITLLSGIEFSEPHLYQKELKVLREYPYDFIIGSIHYVKDMFPDKETRRKFTVEQYFKMYWQEVLEAVKNGNFDSLGHMDFPKRCMGEAFYDYEIIEEILKTMIEQNIALEINTSSLRYGFQDTLPAKDILELYKSLGGRNVTIGSDTHKEEYLAYGNELAKELVAKIGLQEVIFQKHVPINKQ